MTRLAGKPAYCASCFGQPDSRYVDFEAAYDGPVIPGSPHVAIDDLILCENCLKEAFSLLDPQGKDETISELTEMVKVQREELDSKDKQIRGFKATVEELVDHPVATFPGKPKLEGVSPEVRKQITKGRFERRGTTSAPKTRKGKSVEPKAAA